MSELNVKAILRADDPTRISHRRAKGNFRTLGPKLGGRLKAAAEWIGTLEDSVIRRFQAGEPLDYEGHRLEADDLLIEEVAPEGWWVRTDSGITVALDYRLDKELILEGLARECVHIVQNLRKEADLNVARRVTVKIICDGLLREAVNRYDKYIRTETLAVAISEPVGADSLSEFSVAGHSARIGISIA